MTKRIFRAIFLVALGSILACFFLTAFVLYHNISTELEDSLSDEAHTLAIGLAHGGAGYLEALSASDHRITWIAADGTVLYDNRADVAEMENHAGREEVQEAAASSEGYAVRYSSTRSERTVYYALRLEDGSVLRIAGTQRSIFVLLLEALLPVLVVIALVTALSAILAMKLSRRIVRPINDEQGNMRREFTANVSHELKTPLTSISGTAEIMKNGLVRPEDIPHFAGNIYDEASRLVELVNDIIKLSQLDENSIPIEKAPIELRQVAADIIERLSGAAKKRNVTLSLVGGEAIVLGVEPILDEMIYNLVDNAIKYNKEGGSVTVFVTASGGKVRLSVSDTGIGIPPEHQSRVFERFYRVDKSHSKKIGGTGLGLSIVKHAAAYHNAELRLDSRVGEGTTISVTFPQYNA